MKKSESFFQRWVTDNGTYKLVALFITLVLWITFLGRREDIHTAELSMEFLLRDNLVIANEVPYKVEVRISGPQTRIKKLREEFQESITIDLTDYSPGQFPVTIGRSKFQLPFGTKIVSIYPERLTIRLDKLTERSLPVKIKWAGKRPRNYTVESIEPKEVLVKGASSVISQLESVSVKAIDFGAVQVKEKDSRIEVNATLEDINLPGVLPFSDQSVRVFLRSNSRKSGS